MRRKWTEKLIAEMQGQGLGTGLLSSYQPWIEVNSVSSLGVSRRVWGHKTQREHHLLSNVEFNLFLCLEWTQDVVDIREQFPLERELTLAVAESLDIRHPYYPGTHVPTVMTIDFLVTRRRNGEEFIEAFNAKVAEEAEDQNSLQKLEIQREACHLLDFEHHTILDSQIPKQVASNISWVRDALPRPDEQALRPGHLEELCARMQDDFISATGNQTLQSYCESFDRRFGLSMGMGLRVARALIYQRILKADMQSADLPTAGLSAFVMTGSRSKFRVFGAN